VVPALPSRTRCGRPPALGSASLLLAFGGLLPIPVRAQEPPILLPPNADFTGSWTGTGRFTNEWASPVCQYSGRPGSVTLEVRGEGQETTGALSLDMKASSPTCPPLAKRYALHDIKVAGSRIAFVDPAGASWDLAFRTGGLVGIVSWKAGQTDEALAEGFVGPDGSTPLTRLNGEVTLKRQGGETPPGPRGKSSVTGTAKAGIAVIAAEVIAGAALLAVNRYTKQSGNATSNNCSPRSCGVGVPCLCNVQIAVGASCGNTSLGGTVGSPCALPDTPCGAGLSCNSNICQDLATGQCPPQ
jgi:hypothetical protein